MNDICVISCVGNEIVREGGGEVRNKTKCNNVWLVPRPITIDDEGTDALVKNTEGVIGHILSAFKGNIKVLGPSPRHLRPCCDNKDYLVSEENGHRVDMVTFVRGFNMYLERKIDQRGGRVEFIEWTNISTLAGGGGRLGTTRFT